jgi:hypothetical protein
MWTVFTAQNEDWLEQLTFTNIQDAKNMFMLYLFDDLGRQSILR